jgi:large subunit ribosomal protein L30
MTAKTKAKSTPGALLKIQYVRSAIGSPGKHKLIVKSLGFKRLNQVVERLDTLPIRGMVAQIPHLVKILDSN